MKKNWWIFKTIMLGLVASVIAWYFVLYVPVDGEQETLTKFAATLDGFKPDPVMNLNCTDANRDDPGCMPRKGVGREPI